VTSLETKIQETEQRFEETDRVREEWLKKATEAESQINELKNTMQRFFFDCLQLVNAIP
jgi:myosin-5